MKPQVLFIADITTMCSYNTHRKIINKTPIIQFKHHNIVCKWNLHTEGTWNISGADPGTTMWDAGTWGNALMRSLG